MINATRAAIAFARVVATVTLVPLAGVVSAPAQTAESVLDRVHRVDMTTGEGLPPAAFSDEPPPAGEWAVLTETVPTLPEDELTYAADVSFGYVEWTFADGVIVGQVEVPAVELSLEFTLAPATIDRVIDQVPGYRLSARHATPARYGFFYVVDFGTPESLVEANFGANVERIEPDTVELNLRIDPEMTRSLTEAEAIVLTVNAFVEYVRLTHLFLTKGESGAAVFAEAFAAWGLVP